MLFVESAIDSSHLREAGNVPGNRFAVNVRRQLELRMFQRNAARDDTAVISHSVISRRGCDQTWDDALVVSFRKIYLG